jgi:hypothetical protein
VHRDLESALELAEELADELVAEVEAQLAANGEGHPGGIELRLAVHEASTGEPFGTIARLTHGVPAWR